MKILHISNDFSLTRVHRNLYMALDKKQVEQFVFNPVRSATPVGNNHFEFKTTESAIHYSKQLKNYHRFLFRNKISFLYKDLKTNFDLNKITIVHATTLFSDGAIALKLNKKHKIPYIVAVRATDIDVFLKYRPDLRFLCHSILKNASKIIFIGESLKNRFLTHPMIKNYQSLIEKKSEVIHNGINDFWLNDIFTKKQDTPNKILYVGRFVSRKNTVALAKSIIELNNQDYNLELNLVGSGGTDEIHLKELSNQHPKIIKFLGQIGDKQVLKDIYRENHIFAMPSKGETFGLVYLEALSQGLPLLYSKNEGVDGVFDFEIGEKCSSYDIYEIGTRLKDLIENYNNYNLNKIDFSNFRWTNIADRYLNLYKNICGI